METGRQSMVVAPPPPPPPPFTSLAPGFRFHPTDEELVRYYLKRKICGKPFKFQIVSEVEVYKSDPSKLAEHPKLNLRDREWYFFSPVDKKYATSSRLNRATGNGYWKATGRIRDVHHKSQKIGQKKILVFHSGQFPNGTRTNWVMHEYLLLDPEMQAAGVPQDGMVLCRIFEKGGIGPPNRDCYAPYIDEDWDDEEALFVPGVDARDDVENDDETCAKRNNTIMQMDTQMIPVASKRARSENGDLTSESELETFTQFHHKTSQGSYPNSSNTHGSQGSTMTSEQGPITTNLNSSVLATPPSIDASALEKSPEYLQLISDMETKIRMVLEEKDALKAELMQAKAANNALHSRIYHLSIENAELRRGV